jgi:hypothetical protein
MELAWRKVFVSGVKCGRNETVAELNRACG